MNIRRLCLLLPLTFLALTTACGADAPPNQPPTLTLDVGAEETYVVGEDVIQIQATAKDPEGGRVSFEVVNRPERATFQTFANSALFSWDPISSDATEGDPLRLIFVAKDAQGGRTERVVNLTILPGNGTPKFLTASSKLYDPSSDQPLTFDVKVRDDDSQQITLSMPADTAPAGAQFAQDGPKSGTFSWNPTVEQRSQRVHAATFVADDGQSDPVSLKVTIIFQGSGGGGGGTDPGQAQTCDADQPITHTPLGPQRTLDDYEIVAHFSDAAAAKYDKAYLFWTTGDAMNEDVQFDSAEMKIDGTKLHAGIPNLLLSAGESKTVYYAICANDEDAPQDAQDAFVCSPDGFYYSFNAYSPDDTSCVDDTAAGADFASADDIPDQSWGAYRTCDGSPDVHKITVDAGETVEVYGVYSLGQDISFKVYDDAQKQRDLVTTSDCYGIAYIPLDAPATGQKTWYVEVDGADTPYQLTAIRSQQGGGQCGDEQYEPNDTAGQGTLIFDNPAHLSGLSICTADDVDIYAFDALAGDTLQADVLFTHADGDLDAALYAPSQSNSVTVDDYGVAQALSSDDNEEIVHTAAESGIYYLLVFTEDTPNVYDLDITKTCGDSDALGADNHDQSSAALVTPTDYSDLKQCAGQADWYQRTGFAGKTVLVEVSNVRGARASDVDLSVYDSGGKIKSAVVDGDRLELDFTPDAQGQYYYKVSGPSDFMYDMTLLD